jgi:hypothetical protein
MPSPLPELTALLRIRDTENLRGLLAEHASTLGGHLGASPIEMEQLVRLDDRMLFVGLERLVHRWKERSTTQRDAELHAESAGAARQLGSTARFNANGVEINPRLVLGPLLAERSKYVSFHLNDADIAVERARLLQARRALGVFPDLTATVDADALRFGWHGGRGGLVFLPQFVAPSDRDRVLHVVLERPAPAVVTAVTELPALPIGGPSNDVIRVPARKAGAWIADVLAELSSHL